MHGGTCKRGAEHPNFKHGKCSKVMRKAKARMRNFLQRPVQVRIALYPEPFEEWAGKKIEALRKGQRYSVIASLERGLPLAEQERILKAARREIISRLRQVRDEIAGKPSELEEEE